ncbi:MAG: RNA 2',3'-cyclic phosphodiesterase [Burkholderiales bacterium]|nr:RNA 2',3'-cyclic phosphodiesterase [Burkholderiales bacterium]
MIEAADTVRLFFALWPDSALQGRLAAWAKQAAGKARPMRRENLHMTLAFLGATQTTLLPLLTESARTVRFVPFTLRLDRIAYWKHNRIIWCGADQDPPALSALVGELRACLDASAIAYDRKPFVSHVTLVRNAPGLQMAQPWEPLVWEARDFALVQSEKTDGRISYRPLERFSASSA